MLIFKKIYNIFFDTFESVEIEINDSIIWIVDDPNSGPIGPNIESIDNLGHELKDLLEVDAADTSRRVDDETQINGNGTNCYCGSVKNT